MDTILARLGELVLTALPTSLCILILHFYLKKVLFEPLDKTLAARKAATEGARQEAEASLARAAQKTQEFENALRQARSELYQKAEEERTALRAEQAAAIQQAREKAAALVAEARQQIAAEVASARQSLTAQSEALAGNIAAQIMKGSVN